MLNTSTLEAGLLELISISKEPSSRLFAGSLYLCLVCCSYGKGQFLAATMLGCPHLRIEHRLLQNQQPISPGQVCPPRYYPFAVAKTDTTIVGPFEIYNAMI